MLMALEQGRSGRVYNFGGDAERTNLQVVRTILRALGGDDTLLEFVRDRPGHDRRYAVDSGRARAELGWAPGVTFEQGIAATVEWYRSRPEWWRAVKSGAYRSYYEEQYGGRGARHPASGRPS